MIRRHPPKRTPVAPPWHANCRRSSTKPTTGPCECSAAAPPPRPFADELLESAENKDAALTNRQRDHTQLGVRVPAGRPGEQGHRRPFRRADPGCGPGAGRVRHPRLPADGRPGVPHRPGQRVRQHEDRRAARRVRHQKIAVTQGQTLRQRRGRVDEQAAEEGARVPSSRTGTTTPRSSS